MLPLLTVRGTGGHEIGRSGGLGMLPAKAALASTPLELDDDDDDNDGIEELLVAVIGAFDKEDDDEVTKEGDDDGGAL